jgi:tetratricopeptide (TPR) repeat protein
MGEEHHHKPQPTKNRHKTWTENPSEQWSFALDHMDVGEYDLAITHCERAIDIFPSYYDAWLLMAGAFEGKGDMESALLSAQRASEIAVEELGQAWNNLASLHLQRGEFDEAITIDRVLSLIQPSRAPMSSYRMSIAYTALGDSDSGERWLRKAIEHRDDFYQRALSEPRLTAHHNWLHQEENILLKKE